MSVSFAVRVVHEHVVLHEHPNGSECAPQPNGDLLVTEPGGAVATYPNGSWSVAGVGPRTCGFIKSTVWCPICHGEPLPAATTS